MRTKSITLGIGLALLLSATSSYALISCPSGTITKVAAGYSAPTPAGKYYWIDYICTTPPSGWPTTPAGTAANSVRFKFLPDAGAGYANLDGMYATALTAVALGKPVELGIHTFTGNTITSAGTIQASTYVANLSIINQ